MVPAEGGPRFFKLKSSWGRRCRSKILAVSLKYWKGGGGGGPGGRGYPPPPTVYGRCNTSLPLPPSPALQRRRTSQRPRQAGRTPARHTAYHSPAGGHPVNGAPHDVRPPVARAQDVRRPHGREEVVEVREPPDPLRGAVRPAEVQLRPLRDVGQAAAGPVHPLVQVHADDRHGEPQEQDQHGDGPQDGEAGGEGQGHPPGALHVRQEAQDPQDLHRLGPFEEEPCAGGASSATGAGTRLWGWEGPTGTPLRPQLTATGGGGGGGAEFSLRGWGGPRGVGGRGCGPPPAPGDPEVLKAPKKFFGLN